MLSHIIFSYPPGATGDAIQKKFWIRGKTLLHAAKLIADVVLDNADFNKSVSDQYNNPNNIYSKPFKYIPTKNNSWLNVIDGLQLQQSQKPRPVRFLNIGNRTISIGDDTKPYYVLDRTRVEQDKLNTYFTSDEAQKLEENNPTAYIYFREMEAKGKGKKYKIEGPAYSNYAIYLRKHLGRDIDRNALFAKKVRELLGNNNADYSNVLKSKDPDCCLPVLLATLFLAEPARNPRSFMINLMMLNLIEAKATYGGSKDNKPKNYTWDMVLWHPDRLDGWEQGKDNKDYANKPQRLTKIVDKGQRSVDQKVILDFSTYFDQNPQLKNLLLAGGKLPAAMKGSANTLIRDDIEPDNYLTQEKELSVLIRWLCMRYPHLIAVKGDDNSVNQYVSLDGEEIPKEVFNNHKRSFEDSLVKPWVDEQVSEKDFCCAIVNTILVDFLGISIDGAFGPVTLGLKEPIQICSIDDVRLVEDSGDF